MTIYQQIEGYDKFQFMEWLNEISFNPVGAAPEDLSKVANQWVEEHDRRKLAACQANQSAARLAAQEVR